MPSNHKGKGMKGRNYDELSGVGTSSAGRTGTMGNLNDAGHDGSVGTPDLADEGNLQSAAGQPGGTPAQGDSWRGYAGSRQSDTGDNAQRGRSGSQQGQNPSNQQSDKLGSKQSGKPGNQQSAQADQLRGKKSDRKQSAKQASQDEVGTGKPSER